MIKYSTTTDKLRDELRSARRALFTVLVAFHAAQVQHGVPWHQGRVEQCTAEVCQAAMKEYRRREPRSLGRTRGPRDRVIGSGAR